MPNLFNKEDLVTKLLRILSLTWRIQYNAIMNLSTTDAGDHNTTIDKLRSTKTQMTALATKAEKPMWHKKAKKPQYPQ